MSRNLRSESNKSCFAALAVAVLALVALVLSPVAAVAGEDSATVREVTAEIKAGYAYSNENLKDMEGGVSEHGALEFWSSGGLMQWVPGDAPSSEYEYSSLMPKHIKIIVLSEGESAAAMYYAEGRFKMKGGQAVDNYLTRVTEVWVKEGDSWVVRAAHFSPIVGGSGTNQTSLD